MTTLGIFVKKKILYFVLPIYNEVDLANLDIHSYSIGEVVGSAPWIPGR